MKKCLILFLAIIGYAISVNAQNVVIQQNGSTQSSQQTTDPNIYYINGIPSTADIGGVEAQAEYMGDILYLVLTNYREESVTVLYHADLRVGDEEFEKSGSVVLKPGQTKKVNFNQWFFATNIATITRKL